MIKFLTGRQTDPLQEKILEQAVKNYQQNPEEETFIIVPNHIKFTTEVRAINRLAINEEKEQVSVKNLQVLSFSRLAWYFLKDAETGLPTQLDDAAAAMLVAQIIQDKHDELLLFQNVNINSGLSKQLYDTILEIYDSNVDLDDLEPDDSTNQETQNKIHDLKIIYKEFIRRIEGKFSTKNEVELQLNELLAQKDDLKNTSFYFTDFSHFSLQEILTIKLLMNKAKNVTFAFKTRLGEITENVEAGDYDYVIQRTINQLISFCNKRGLEYTCDKFPIEGKLSGKELLNSVWINAIAPKDKLDQVQLVKADSRYAEAYFAARTIYQQVALSNYRYRDFLILAPNLHEYETYLNPILRQNNIPFFNDLQQEMKYHPLVILIENLAALIKKGLQTQNLLTILKTRMLIPEWYKGKLAQYVKDVDMLENYVLAHGIDYTNWEKKLSSFSDANVIALDQKPDEIERLEQLRSYLIDQIKRLTNALKKEKDTNEALKTFFNFLVNNGVAARLDEWRNEADQAGDLQQAQQPEQLWNLLIQLLKDYKIINNGNFKLDSFFDMLISGFREASFSQIPSTLDAVNVSEIGMVQSSHYKQVFIIGATATNLPKIQKTPGFLSSENLEEIAANFSEDAYIEDRQQINNLDQNYQFGLAMSLAEDHVYVSYPVLNASNEQLEPSIFYSQLKNYNAPEMTQHDLPDKLQDLLSFITNPAASLGYITYLNSVEQGNEIKKLIELSKKYLPEETDQVIEASHFDNNPDDIGPELAEKLYSKDLITSVSQLETYNQNSFEYFLKYGLRLHKRLENDLDLSQSGNYFHETFDRLVKEMNKEGLDLAEIDEEKLQTLLAAARVAMREEGRYAQLMNNAFNRYLFDNLDQTTTKVAKSWHKKAKETPLKPYLSELSFGSQEKLKGLKFEVPNLAGDHNIILRGKIDRLDLAKLDNDHVLAQVIDYKSSAKKFDLGMFYNGTEMQMVSYLDVINQNFPALTNQEKIALFGAFYQTITQQTERLNSKTVFDSNLQIKENLLDSKPKLMYNGLISSDPDLITKAEPALEKGGTASQIYSGVRSKKTGGFTLPRDHSFIQEEMDLLLKYDEYLIKKASNEILSGKVELNPYRYNKGRNAITYSDYRDVFFFDAMLNEDEYHEISGMNKKELMEKIKEILEKEQ